MYTKDELVQVNSELLAKDDSDSWPINGKFNATKRAINRVRKAMNAGLCIDDIENYRETVINQISLIVNEET